MNSNQHRPDHGLELLWAPWRMGYIRSLKDSQCPFCLPEDGSEDRRRHVLARGKYAYVCLNLYPYNNGHLLIPPYAHEGDILELPAAAVAEMGDLMRISIAVLRRWARPQGFNIGYNLGEAAGAGVTDHLHMHVIPRWLGDTSFLCVVSATKVVVQALDESYEELRPLFDETMAEYGTGPHGHLQP